MNANNVPERWKFPCMCTRPRATWRSPGTGRAPGTHFTQTAALLHCPLGMMLHHPPSTRPGARCVPRASSRAAALLREHGKPPAPSTTQPTGGQPRGKVSTSPGFHPPPAPRGTGCTAKSRKLSRALEARGPAGPTLSLLSAIKKIEGK